MRLRLQELVATVPADAHVPARHDDCIAFGRETNRAIVVSFRRLALNLNFVFLQLVRLGKSEDRLDLKGVSIDDDKLLGSPYSSDHTILIFCEYAIADKRAT